MFYWTYDGADDVMIDVTNKLHTYPLSLRNKNYLNCTLGSGWSDWAIFEIYVQMWS